MRIWGTLGFELCREPGLSGAGDGRLESDWPVVSCQNEQLRHTSTRVMIRKSRLKFEEQEQERTDLGMVSQRWAEGLDVGSRGVKLVAVVDRIAEGQADGQAAGGMVFAYGLVSYQVEMRSGHGRRAGHWTGRKNHRAGIEKRQQQRKDFEPGKDKLVGRGYS